MIITLFTLNMYGCTDTAELLPVEPDSIGVSAQEIKLVESELNAAYALWETDEYDQAFIALERINHDTMKTVWPILRSEDPESSLELEVHFGKVLWATERKKSIAGNESAGALKMLLMRELNEVRLEEPAPDVGTSEDSNGVKTLKKSTP